MNKEEQVGEYYSPRQYVQHVLPRSYEVKETITGIIRCISPIGIEDEDRWQKIFNLIKGHFGGAFKEINHITCANHLNFTVYFNYKKYIHK